MTLIELVVVLTIIGIVLGIGAAMFAASRKDLGLRTAHADLIGKLRFARAQAVVRRAPARIRADAGDRRIDVLLDRTFGLWHAEDLKTTGAFGIDGRPQGVDLEIGKIGYAFRFKGSGSVQVDGFAVPPGAEALSAEAWVYPDDIGVPQTVLEKAGEMGLRVEQDGVLSAQFGAARIRVDDPRLALQQWSHLRVAAEDGEAVLYLNGRPVGGEPLAQLPRAGAAPLTIGSGGGGGFRGLIDEVAVRGRVVEETGTYLDTVTWTIANGAADPGAKGVAVIHLTDQGRLDPARHAGPVTVTLTSGTEKRVVKIGWMGTLEP